MLYIYVYIICVYIHIRIYVYVCVYIHIYIYIHRSLSLYIYIYMYTLYIYIYIYIYTYTYQTACDSVTLIYTAYRRGHATRRDVEARRRETPGAREGSFDVAGTTASRAAASTDI